MIFISAIAIAIGEIHAHLLNNSLTDLLMQCARWASSQCESVLPASHYQELYGAMICGRLPDNREWLQLFRESGLYHLLVISGSHLIFLHQGLQYLQRLIPYPKALGHSLLGVFCLACGLNPPVMRSWIHLGLNSWTRSWHWSSAQCQWLAGILCFTLMPSWAESASLQLSWLAAIAVDFPLRRPTALKRASLIFMILLPVLSSFGRPHPAHILSNWLMTAAFGTILLPACLLAFAFPWFTPLTDEIWRLTLIVLESGRVPSELGLSHKPWPPLLVWIYVLTWQSLSHLQNWRGRTP